MKPTFWVGCQLIFGSITNQSFTFGCERHVRWCDTVTLIVSDDFNPTIFEDANTRIGCTEINTDHSANIYSIE
jgi:hypothetical protein